MSPTYPQAQTLEGLKSWTSVVLGFPLDLSPSCIAPLLLASQSQRGCGAGGSSLRA